MDVFLFVTFLLRSLSNLGWNIASSRKPRTKVISLFSFLFFLSRSVMSSSFLISFIPRVALSLSFVRLDIISLSSCFQGDKIISEVSTMETMMISSEEFYVDGETGPYSIRTTDLMTDLVFAGFLLFWEIFQQLLQTHIHYIFKKWISNLIHSYLSIIQRGLIRYQCTG